MFPDRIAEASINLDATLRVANRYKGLICGIKARMVSPALEIFGMEMPRLTKRAARESGTKLMVRPLSDLVFTGEPHAGLRLRVSQETIQHAHSALKSCFAISLGERKYYVREEPRTP